MEFLATYHPQITHGPIVLLIVGFVFELIGLALDRPWWRKAATALLVLGVAGAILAVLSGNEAGEIAEKQQIPEDDVDAHQLMAYMTLWYSIGALVLRGLAARAGRFRTLLAGISLLGWLAACVFVGIAAHRGGDLVFEHGAAVEPLGRSRRPEVAKAQHPGTEAREREEKEREEKERQEHERGGR